MLGCLDRRIVCGEPHHQAQGTGCREAGLYPPGCPGKDDFDLRATLGRAPLYQPDRRPQRKGCDRRRSAWFQGSALCATRRGSDPDQAAAFRRGGRAPGRLLPRPQASHHPQVRPAALAAHFPWRWLGTGRRHLRQAFGRASVLGRLSGAHRRADQGVARPCREIRPRGQDPLRHAPADRLP
ncbi:hypothetical protein D9M72_553370 [compost metagenome]